MTSPAPVGFGAVVQHLVNQAVLAYADQQEQVAAQAIILWGAAGTTRLDWTECGHTAFVPASHNLDAHPHWCPICPARRPRPEGCDVPFLPVIPAITRRR